MLTFYVMKTKLNDYTLHSLYRWTRARADGLIYTLRENKQKSNYWLRTLDVAIRQVSDWQMVGYITQAKGVEVNIALSG